MFGLALLGDSLAFPTRQSINRMKRTHLQCPQGSLCRVCVMAVSLSGEVSVAEGRVSPRSEQGRGFTEPFTVSRVSAAAAVPWSDLEGIREMLLTR